MAHPIAGTRVTLGGRFNFHLDPATYTSLVAQEAWLTFVPSEGDRFLLVPLRDTTWPAYVGWAEGKVKWIAMMLPFVEERWSGYVMPLRRG